MRYMAILTAGIVMAILSACGGSGGVGGGAGDGCSTADDCKSGLVCQTGQCVLPADADSDADSESAPHPDGDAESTPVDGDATSGDFDSDTASGERDSDAESADGDSESAESQVDGDSDSESCIMYYRDDDQDGYGVTTDSKCLNAPEGAYTARRGGDCNDANAAVNPGATEISNGIDDNCDGQIDEAPAWLPCNRSDVYNLLFCDSFDTRSTADLASLYIFQGDSAADTATITVGGTFADPSHYFSGRWLTLTSVSNSKATLVVDDKNPVPGFRLPGFSFALYYHGVTAASTTPMVFIGTESGTIALTVNAITNAVTARDGLTKAERACLTLDATVAHRFDIAVDSMHNTYDVLVDNAFTNCRGLPAGLERAIDLNQLAFQSIGGVTAEIDNLMFSQNVTLPLLQNAAATLCALGLQTASACGTIHQLSGDPLACLTDADTYWCPAICGLRVSDCSQMSDCITNECELSPDPGVLTVSGATTFAWSSGVMQFSVDLLASNHTVLLNDPLPYIGYESTVGFAYFMPKHLGSVRFGAWNDANANGTLETGEDLGKSATLDIGSDDISDITIAE